MKTRLPFLFSLIALGFPAFADGPAPGASHSHREVRQAIVYNRGTGRSPISGPRNNPGWRQRARAQLASFAHHRQRPAYAAHRHPLAAFSRRPPEDQHSPPGRHLQTPIGRHYAQGRFPESLPEYDLRHRTAQLDRIRDRAIATGDLRLLQWSREMERQLRNTATSEYLPTAR